MMNYLFSIQYIAFNDTHSTVNNRLFLFEKRCSIKQKVMENPIISKLVEANEIKWETLSVSLLNTHADFIQF